MSRMVKTVSSPVIVADPAGQPTRAMQDQSPTGGAETVIRVEEHPPATPEAPR